MFSQFSIALAAAAVLVCVCGGALLRREPRTIKSNLARGVLASSFAVCAVQAASCGFAAGALALPAAALQALVCAAAGVPSLLAVFYLVHALHDVRLSGRRAWLAAIPFALGAAVCAGAFAWSLSMADAAAAFAPFAVAAPVVALIHAAAMAAGCILSRRSRALTVREIWAASLLAVLSTAGSAACLAGFGLSALLLGTACGAVLFAALTSFPSAAAIPGTRLYSRSAFLETVRALYEEARPFTCTAVVLEQLPLLEQSGTPSAALALTREVEGFLVRAARRSAVYRIEPTTFVVLDAGAERREQMMAEMERRFEQPWGAFGRLEIRFVKLYAPQDCTDAPGLVRVLTELASEARRAGGPMLLSCDEAMHERTERRRLIADVFRRALDSGTLDVVFRPIYTPRVHRVTAAQAYASLRDDALGTISDEELRFAAREAHAELRFGELLFDRLCASLAGSCLTEAGIDTIHLALSPLQWQRSGLADTLSAVAHRHGMELSRFVFEADENIVNDESGEYAANADRLFAFGARTAISGFGAGESNLVRLLGLDAKLIKLDAALVHAYCRKETSVPDYLAPLFASKGKQLMADGVETKNHADAMTHLGCAGLQGDYYARPMPAKELVAYVSSATSAWEQFVREHTPPERKTEEKQAEP